MLKAQFGKDPPYRHIPCSVERRIYDPDIIRHFLDDFRVDDLLFQFHHISVVNFSADHLIKACFYRFVLIHCLYLMIIRNFLHFFNNFFILRSGHLSAILPICLISIVFRRIMACRDHNTGNTSKIAQGKRKLRRRAQGVKHISLDPISRKAKSRLVRKFR